MSKSETPGTSTSGAEVTNISRHGFWLLVDGRELFLSFEEFPWFKSAKEVEAILNIDRPQPHHLCWPDLDRRSCGGLDRAPRAVPTKGQGRIGTRQAGRSAEAGRSQSLQEKTA